MPEWRQGSYDGVFYLGKEGTEEYGGYVVRVQSDPLPEKWFAYEQDTRKGEHVWVAAAPTREAAQSAVQGEFLCEVWRNKETGHCPYPGAVVRSTVYQGERLRLVLCGKHSAVMKGWETDHVTDYRCEFGLIPDTGIYGDRVVPPLDYPTIQECAYDATTMTERNMWIALGRVVHPLAELHYWRAHYARYPLDLNERSSIDAQGQWKRAQEHAQGMYEVFMREDHGQENATLPNDLVRLIEREAVNYLKSKKGGK
ncbi:hypothetical protein ACWD25_29930 [Streptomyces sp. NPDC002920]